jgi:hypothetical protein
MSTSCGIDGQKKEDIEERTEIRKKQKKIEKSA